MAHLLSVIDFAGMFCAFLLLWSQKEEIIYGVSVMHYNDDEKQIANWPDQ